MKVIGLIGLIGSGKDTMGDYIAKRHGYKMIVMGDIVRELAKELGRELTRDNLQLTQKEYSKKYGNEFFVRKVIGKIQKNSYTKVVVNGIRRPEDASVLKQEYKNDMLIIRLDAKPETRFKRLKKRNRVSDPKTLGEFLRQEENEYKYFDYKETFKYTDVVIDAGKGLIAVQKQIDELLKKKGVRLKKRA